ncbi:CinA family protein [Polluticaenibacter yanchengensis]|uniref:CinA family protein n=1 Tax=Polluticaenibacter yanchengensis TaxID=3014562 RepID=A0ABT4UG83_9BACT|nr:CinA family protein [Chitinophagaceae bacterium LY-5]
MYEHLTRFRHHLQPHLDIIRNICKSKNETIAVAESVTAGCIQLLLSTSEGAREFFQGGITVYNCSQKSIHLNVEPVYAYSCNGVDASIAVTMANHVCTLFRAQIGISITGYATKMPEEGVNDLYAYIAIVRNGTLLYNEKLETTYEGIAAQWDYAEKTIKKTAGLLQ